MKKIISILFLVFTINLLIFSSISVNGELITSSSHRIDWDDFPIGLTSGSGTNNWFNFDRGLGDDFRVVADYINSSAKMLYQYWTTWAMGADAVDTGDIYINNDGVISNATRVKIYHNFYGFGTGTHPDAEAGAKIWTFYRNGTIVMRLAWKTTYYYDLTGVVNYNGYCIYNYTDNEWNQFYTGGGSGYGNIDSYLNITIGSQDWAFNTSSVILQRVSNDEVLAVQSGLETGDDLPYDFFDRIEITYGFRGGSGTKQVRIQEEIDDIVFFSTGLPSDPPDVQNALSFNLFDIATGTQLRIFGNNFPMSWLNLYEPAVRTMIYSDLWSGDYNNYGDFGNTITLEGLDISVFGEWHYFNFTNAVGNINGEYINYYNSTNYMKVFPEQTLTIYLSSVSDYGGYSNCVERTHLEGITTELCSDKQFYTQGESINFRYKAPNEIDLYNVWWLPSSHYYLWIYSPSNLHWLFQTTRGTRYSENADYIENYAISLNNEYDYLQWKYNETGESGYKTVTGGRDSYKAFIGHGGGQLFGGDTILAGNLVFYITSGIFTPSGNITSISPASPEIGQRTQIAFDVNNEGYMTVRNLLSPSETELTITPFAKFTGTSFVNYTFWEYGEYLLTLYVNDGLEYTSVDTYNLSVKTLNGTYGGFGYNVEFLTCEPARVIAGFDTLHVNYRSLSSDGYILINDSRGQQTPFSTFIGVKTGVLSIPIPNYGEIGEWNITLFGNSTLYSNFQVVAEENNWVEFAKNVFYNDEPFEIELKHDRKIEVVFYKEGIAHGRDWFLETGLLASGIFSVPTDIAFPEIGTWKVEIWQVNNFIKIQKLAEDTCLVKTRPFTPDDIVVDDDIAGYLSNIDPFYQGLIGIFIVLLCTFMPFIAIKELGEHGVQFKVDIPPMLYTICCGVGAVVALILGVWPIQYTFFICVMAGFGTFALYLMGKRNGSE